MNISLTCNWSETAVAVETATRALGLVGGGSIGTTQPGRARLSIWIKETRSFTEQSETKGGIAGIHRGVDIHGPARRHYMILDAHGEPVRSSESLLDGSLGLLRPARFLTIS
jgi:hypothetical protein